MVDWDVFHYKNMGKQEQMFEKMTYYLFCDEYHQPFGIEKYYNQVGIETMPIQFKNKEIGFQSKYYAPSTKLSNKKGEIIEFIYKIHEKYPKLSILVIYLNKEFGMSTKKDKIKPSMQEEIEVLAKELGIEIQWKFPSQIEKQLMENQNKTIRELFFRQDQSIEKAIEQMSFHTQMMFQNVHHNIEKDNIKIQISRKTEENIILKKMQEKKLPIILVYGESGCGKTAIFKSIYEKKKDIPFFYFKATEFNVKSTREFFNAFGEINSFQFHNFYDKQSEKIICIDSAEKICFLENQDILTNFLIECIQNGWKIFLGVTIHSYKEVQYYIEQVLQKEYYAIEIETIPMEKLEKIFHTNHLILPKSKMTLQLLQIPFYLKEYIQSTNFSDKSNALANLKERLWNYKMIANIQKANNMNIRREELLLYFAKEILKTDYFGVEISENKKDEMALSKLIESEVIQYDSIYHVYYMTHDIYENWAIERLIDDCYRKNEQAEIFLKTIGNTAKAKRNFRAWYQEKLEQNKEDMLMFTKEVLNSKLPFCKEYKKEIWIVILSFHENLLLEWEDFLEIETKKIIYNWCDWLINFCQIPDTQFSSQGVRPNGKGWEYVISYLDQEKEKLLDNLSMIQKVITLLYQWNSYKETGKATKQAVNIAVYIYKLLKQRGDIKDILLPEEMEKLFMTMVKGSEENINLIEHMIKKTIQNETIQDNGYVEFCKYLISSSMVPIENVLDKNEELYWNMAEIFWKEENDLGSAYFPVSAYQTTFYRLLCYHPEKYIKKIVYMVNAYMKQYQKETEIIRILVNKGKHVEQKGNEELWNLHRTGIGTNHVIACLHMALEKWLLEWIPTKTGEEAEKVLRYLIENSLSVSITAVVCSVILAYPNKLHQIAYLLFPIKPFWKWDKKRKKEEKRMDELILDLPRARLYFIERIQSNHLFFRKRDMLYLLCYYQKQDDKKEKVYQILDQYYQICDEQGDKKAKFDLYFYDIRKLEKNKKKTLKKEYQEEAKQIYAKKTDCLYENHDLLMWSLARNKKEEKEYKKYPQYEKNIKQAYQELWKLEEKIGKLEREVELYEWVLSSNIATVLLCNFSTYFSKEERIELEKLVIRKGNRIVEKYYQNQLKKYEIFHATETFRGISYISAHGVLTKREAFEIQFLILLKGEEYFLPYYIKMLKEFCPNFTKEFISFSVKNIEKFYDYLDKKTEGEDKLERIRHFLKTRENQIERNLSIDDFKQIKKKDDLRVLGYLLIVLQVMSESYGQYQESCLYLVKYIYSTIKKNKNMLAFQMIKGKYMMAVCQMLNYMNKREIDSVFPIFTGYIGMNDITDEMIRFILASEKQLVENGTFYYILEKIFEALKKFYKKKNLKHVPGFFYCDMADGILIYLFKNAIQIPEKNREKIQKQQVKLFRKAIKSVKSNPNLLLNCLSLQLRRGDQYWKKSGIYLLVEMLSNKELDKNWATDTKENIEKYMEDYINIYLREIKKEKNRRKMVEEVLENLIQNGSSKAFLLREML